MNRLKVNRADDANVIGIHEYDLASELKTLSKIGGALEDLRPQMLSDINQDLLTEEQRVLKKST